ncbi:hypothetical protein [Rubinisphaera brasiliensis]|uniref:Uncharacterized protein n=1 Tax=Rubinisphaera brasiliensis (strain ATCC 49424 / DSM 5305 / JCM 21570 / IAM 15109 / NBRC 103401 / IFAM 1448) TaxID=756272 RepID=F0SSD8_RUBBR|nr:hypothetical protein [Rubinisphaera brasiliensis]ADY59209.1 hypothetical protein Plabr_1598 [Rubinisphaera brasiliensis DSM 5305]
MDRRIRSILEDLEAVRENLLALSDDIWLSIDHNDSNALDRGYEFKKAYNQKLEAFDSVATSLSGLVQQFTSIQLDAGEESGAEDESENTRIIAELNREEPHSLDEDFTYLRPHGFILDGKGTLGITTWRRMYEVFCLQLAHRDADRFRRLPELDDFTSSRGHSSFSRDESTLRQATAIADGVFAEVNLSANSLRDHMKKLMKTFRIPEDQMTVYLREDRDSTRDRVAKAE